MSGGRPSSIKRFVLCAAVSLHICVPDFIRNIFLKYFFLHFIPYAGDHNMDNNYRTLYRKWRPLTFDDVISQEHIAVTLKNQLTHNRTSHAYLFSGSRGTGKTTCARIFAKALNCPNMKDGNPCLECEICREAENGSLTDIVEIDAASNNGVDDMRDLREGAVYSPDKCRYRVYIIDEVHMLSVNAFNALLKIMEEPPSYVKFILATTELHKVPATILSRCQKFGFRRIKNADISKRLLYIAQQENIDLTKDGADLIASLSDGGMRDAVSLLDQCSSLSEEITVSVVSETAGVAGRDYLYEILDAISCHDTAKALSVTDSLCDMSKDLARLCDELILQLRNAMLLKLGSDTENLISCMPDELPKLREIAGKSDISLIMQRLEILQTCRERMQRVMNRRVEFEMTLIKLCDDLQRQVPTAPQVRQVPQTPDTPQSRQVPQNPETPKPPATVSYTPENVRPCENWETIVENFKVARPAMAGTLYDSNAGVDGNIFIIFTPNRLLASYFKKDTESAVALLKIVNNALGGGIKRIRIIPTSADDRRDLPGELIENARRRNINVSTENNI